MYYLYEITYHYEGEKDNSSCNVIIYDPETPLQEALDEEKLNTVNGIVQDKFGLSDDDICFYHEFGESFVDTVLDLQKSHDIVIEEIVHISSETIDK